VHTGGAHVSRVDGANDEGHAVVAGVEAVGGKAVHEQNVTKMHWGTRLVDVNKV
jgi:hypothetical protein